MVSTAAQIWRNWTTDGVPSSGKHDPEKIEIRAWGSRLENRLFNIQEGEELISDIRWYGYFGDGVSHPLASVSFFKGEATFAWTLARWQQEVPQVDSLTNEIDRIAVQAWFNDRPKGGTIRFPDGIAIFDKGIKTGLDQNVIIKCGGNGAFKVRYSEVGGTMWEHGGKLAEAASNAGTFKVADGFRVQPMVRCHCVFWIRYSGTPSPVYAIDIENMLVVAEDGTSYFDHFARIWNYKRGCTIRNNAIYGRHFYTLPTDAIIFEPNAGGHCPPGQVNQLAGNTVDAYNNMTVGYRYAVCYNYDGFTSTAEHCHEEGQFVNLQAYSGVGLFRALNDNTNFAFSDNFTFITCGWQGIGPAFNIRRLEHVRVRDTLFVNNEVTDASVANYFNIINCSSVIIEGNEFFIVVNGAIPFTPCYVGGSETYGVAFLRNGIVLFDDVIASFISVAADVPLGGFEERANKFRGTGTYTNGKVYDLSNKGVSEQRAIDIVKATGDGKGSVTVHADGSIEWTDDVGTTFGDTFGNTLVTFPTGLFRNEIISILVANGDLTKVISPPMRAGFNTGGVTIRYPNMGSTGAATPGISAGGAVTTAIKVVGR